MRYSRTFVLTAVVLLFSATIVAGGVSDPVRDREKSAGGISPDDIPENLSVKPVDFTSENGDFKITFPGGCGKLVTRSNEPDLFGGEEWDDIIQVTYVFCDRYQTEGEGCSIRATFNLHDQDGGMAGPQHVVTGVEEYLKHFQAKIVRQKAVRREFENGIVAEGVEIHAKPADGPGEVWLRGLLVEGDIYVLAAWNHQGGLWNNPDYMAFFNSFQPWTE
ncbi:MAG: hypothetical protein ABFS42_02470 [Candidatus Krumholzibacteriota bacterium]